MIPKVTNEGLHAWPAGELEPLMPLDIVFDRQVGIRVERVATSVFQIDA